MSSNKYGLDLGSDTIKVYIRSTGAVIKEKNLIAKKRKDIVALGDDADFLMGKVSDNISISCPLRKGVIADLSSVGTIMTHALKKAGCSKKLLSPNVFYLAVPSAITEVEKRAFHSIISESGFNSKNSKIVERPIAEAIGLGIDFKESKGTLIADLGAETTEVSVISMGGIMISRLIPYGSNDINRTIMEVLRTKDHLRIGFRSAEEIKLSFLNQHKEDEDIITYGIDLLKGIPRKAYIDHNLVDRQIQFVIKRINDEINKIIDGIPAEMYSVIRTNGIHLTGGLSASPYIASLIEKGTGIKALTKESPELVSINGLSKIIEDKSLSSMAFTISESEFE